ncbi:hypothetical protein [Pedobacter ureilyticus]|uniref:Uncharacterized protein n=1 Tax=Pedobacter ureilyticus TaxID=1393051 RepID=A0ABW9JC99_9SPHI|nr:hypothetical protein [Pedobacter helvus]
MKFEIGGILEEMLLALRKETGKGWKQIRVVSEQFAELNKDRLQLIAELRLDNELTEEEFLARLEDEKLMLEVQLNTLKVLTKAVVQKAVNAAFKILGDAVSTLIAPLR